MFIHTVPALFFCILFLVDARADMRERRDLIVSRRGDRNRAAYIITIFFFGQLLLTGRAIVARRPCFIAGPVKVAARRPRTRRCLRDTR